MHKLRFVLIGTLLFLLIISADASNSISNNTSDSESSNPNTVAAESQGVCKFNSLDFEEIGSTPYTGRANAAILRGDYLYINRMGTGMQVFGLDENCEFVSNDFFEVANQEFIFRMDCVGERLYSFIGQRIGVWDLSNPATPVPIEHDVTLRSNVVYSVAAIGDTVYFSGCDYFEPITEYFLGTDFTNPAAPSRLAGITGMGGSMYLVPIIVDTSRFIVLDGAELRVVDVTNPSEPVLVNSINHVCSNMVGNRRTFVTLLGGVPDEERKLYLWSVDTSGELSILDSTETAPFLGLAIHENLLAASVAEGIKFYNIENDHYFQNVGYLETPAGSLLRAMDDTRFVYADSDSLYVFYIENILEVDEPGSIEIPISFYIENAYPNPFNSSINLEMNLPEMGDVKLSLLVVTGRRVHEDIYGPFFAGSNRIRISPLQMASGVYLLRAVHGNRTAVRRIVYLK